MEPSLIDFLRERNVEENVIDKMKEDKIDCKVITLMTDVDLSRYIKHYGDRISVKSFSQKEITEISNTDLIADRIRGKCQGRREKKRLRTEEPTTRAAGQKGNANATKELRRVELGWIAQDANGNCRQIKEPRGGGTKHLRVSHDCKVLSLLQEAKTLYFPNGENKTGLKEKNHEFDLWDSNHENINADITVADLYANLKVKILRVYMVTSAKPEISDESTISTPKNTKSFVHLLAGTPTISFRIDHLNGLDTDSSRQDIGAENSPSTHDTVENSSLTQSTEVLQSSTNNALIRSSPTESGDAIFRGPLPDLDISDEDFADDHIYRFDNNREVPINSTEEIPASTQVSASEMSQNMTSLHSILKGLNSNIDRSLKRNIVNVDRDNVLDGGFRAFNREKFSVWAPLSVKFAAEQGIDNGGPTREFLQLAIREIRNLTIFEGKEYEKHLSLDYKALETNTYGVVGKLMAYSIVHGGPLPMFFSPVLYDAIVGGIDDTHPKVSDIPDYEMKEKVKKILESSDEQSFRNAISDIEDTIILSGCYSIATKYDNRASLVENISHFLVLGRVSMVLTKLKAGLATCGVLRKIQEFPDIMRAAFVNSVDDDLDALTMETFLPIMLSAWSPDGTHRFRKEKRTQTHWRDFLQDLEDIGKLNLLLMFVLGLEHIPPLGVTPTPEVLFGHREDIDNTYTAAFPVANTCSNTLRIPVLDSYDEFKRNMLSAIENVQMFTDQ